MKVTGNDMGGTTCMAMVSPCPCCFGSILASIILTALSIAVSSLIIGSYSSIVLMIILIVTYLLSSLIVRKINKPYPLILGNFMIFMGLYFILCIIILHNMVYIAQESAITIQDSNRDI